MPAKQHIACLGFAIVLQANLALAQVTVATPAEAARQYATANQSELLQRFSDFLAIPNVAADPDNLKRNADLLVSELKKRGIESQLLSIPGTPSIVYGRIDTPG